jgi:cytochrome c
MDTMEVNKAVAAVLTAGIAFMGATLLAGALVSPTPLKQPAITIDMSAVQTAGGPAAPSGPAPIAPLLAAASADQGQQLASKVCAICHNFNEGGTAKVGPDLYGVLGRQVATFPGFDYSSALKGKKGPWTYDELNEWLYKPAGYAPGTRMAFAGLSNNKQRADVIDYLRSLSHNPEPLPAVTATPAAAHAAAAPSGPPSIDTALATGDEPAGDKFAHQVCGICHTFNKGDPARVGPNLYGILGEPHAHMAGFDYSSALKGKQGPWTYDELNAWLTSPQKYAPGTRMAFPGIPQEKMRANVILFLRSLSDHPEALPAAGGTTPAAATAPAAPAPAAAVPAPVAKP